MTQCTTLPAVPDRLHLHVRSWGYADITAARALELFEQIDINGDGEVEWDEFMAYVIAAGHLRLRSTVSEVRSKQVRSTHQI